ncbi:hypothetical protein E2C01_016291 [Portunus trituberculatus]|uniref:Uncharacterized protein n=1 Tax=Portunus trituberculatus TaxID=210409 RepID=A0A5B7DNP6_PORTR|nr:hypothetical protein [Portunus trituberculatus]
MNEKKPEETRLVVYGDLKNCDAINVSIRATLTGGRESSRTRELLPLGPPFWNMCTNSSKLILPSPSTSRRLNSCSNTCRGNGGLLSARSSTHLLIVARVRQAAGLTVRRWAGTQAPLGSGTHVTLWALQ